MNRWSVYQSPIPMLAERRHPVSEPESRCNQRAFRYRSSMLLTENQPGTIEIRYLYDAARGIGGDFSSRCCAREYDCMVRKPDIAPRHERNIRYRVRFRSLVVPTEIPCPLSEPDRKPIYIRYACRLAHIPSPNHNGTYHAIHGIAARSNDAYLFAIYS